MVIARSTISRSSYFVLTTLGTRFLCAVDGVYLTPCARSAVRSVAGSRTVSFLAQTSSASTISSWIPEAGCIITINFTLLGSTIRHPWLVEVEYLPPLRILTHFLYIYVFLAPYFNLALFIAFPENPYILLLSCYNYLLLYIHFPEKWYSYIPTLPPSFLICSWLTRFLLIHYKLFVFQQLFICSSNHFRIIV